MGGADIEIRVTPAKRTISVDLGPKSTHLSSPESYFEGLSAAKWNAQYFTAETPSSQRSEYLLIKNSFLGALAVVRTKPRNSPC